MDESRHRDYTLLLLPLLLLGVIILKFPHLFLPHFWDEAWSYSPAVQYMYEHRLSLLPGSLPPELSRGHPLMFYFLSAGWMRIFGPSLFSKHCFALAVSLIYLVSIYYTGRKLFSARTGIMAAIFTSCQAIFLAQSSMLLPEIMLSLFTVWTLFAFLEKKKILFLLCSSLLIMTKETGIFLLILLFAWHLGSFLFSRKMRSAPGKQFAWLILLIFPFLEFLLFLFIQKQHFGWYLFPEHVGLITTISKGLKELGSQAYFLQFYGQIFLVIALAVSFLVRMFSEGEIPPRQKQALWLIFTFILFYLFATTFLLFNPRYLICIHVMLVMLTAFFLEIVPDYDLDRVYISDIRKIISWYNLLIEHQLLDFTEKEEEKPEEKAENKVEEKTEEKIEEKAEEPPVTVPAAKKKKPAVKKTEGEETTVKKKETVAKKKPKSNPS